MDVKDFDNDIDLRLNLLCGDPLHADSVEVRPLTLRQIKDVGYSAYSKYLSILTMEKKDILQDVAEFDEYSLIDIVIMSQSDILLKAFSEGLALFLGETVEDLVITDKAFIFGAKDSSRDIRDCKVINFSNFADIVQILKYQNCLIGATETYKRTNPADEKAKRILEKLKKSKEILSKKKAEESSPDQEIDIADIVSAVSTKSNTYNKSNIWDITTYQLYDEYRRLEAISTYETNILAMIQGAKIDNLKHWSAKID
ncbi:hypothetical protein MKY96_33145 [Paenibacillus sp. FSL R7-0302]|uniref:hypothetical protein n=1 Tax=Paenibacillus sp. FSL R7-0302 TaxID=2921681 RepID=UPI0030FC52A6